MKTILLADRFAQESLVLLQQQPHLQVMRSTFGTTPSPEELSKAHALIIRSKTQIHESLLKAAPQLQLVISCTSGFDHIDLEATRKWGITVMHTPNAHIESASQLTWSLVLACCNRLLESHRMVKSGEWNRETIVGLELSGATYGIVGLGRIGSRVAQLAQAFGMKVIAFDPYQEESTFQKQKVTRVSYEELLKAADVISFHVPKTLETNHMLKASHFEYIQRGVVLVNTSRGSVIREEDLVQALQEGWIRSAGLDVFEKEPLPRTSQLLNFSQVVLTPHIGAQTEEAFYKASQSAAEKCIRFFTDGSTSDTLPPQVPWYGVTPWLKNS